MRFEVVDAAGNEGRGIENAVTAMDHVVVERQHHQRRVGDDAAELTRVERVEFDRLTLAHVRSAAMTWSGARTFRGVETGMPTLYRG